LLPLATTHGNERGVQAKIAANQNQQRKHQSPKEIEALSNSFQENKATVAQLWCQLQMNEQLQDQLLDSLPWTIQIVQELERKLYRKLNTRSSKLN